MRRAAAPRRRLLARWRSALARWRRGAAACAREAEQRLYLGEVTMLAEQVGRRWRRQGESVLLAVLRPARLRLLARARARVRYDAAESREVFRLRAAGSAANPHDAAAAVDAAAVALDLPS